MPSLPSYTHDRRYETSSHAPHADRVSARASTPVAGAGARLIPVCMWCQRVGFRHDGREDWMHVTSSTRDAFRSRWMAPHLTHGLCPECLALHYPDIAWSGAAACADLPAPRERIVADRSAWAASRRPREAADERVECALVG